MRLDTMAGLDDISRASALIQSAISGVSLEQFLANWEKQSAIERQFKMIGEALIKTRDREPIVFDSIPDSRAIIGFRSLLADGYDVADPEVVFELADSKLSELREIVEHLLAEA